MVEHAAQRYGDVQVRRHRLAGQPNLVLARQPAQFSDVPRRSQRRIQRIRKLPKQRQVLRPTDALAHAHYCIRAVKFRALSRFVHNALNGLYPRLPQRIQWYMPHSRVDAFVRRHRREQPRSHRRHVRLRVRKYRRDYVPTKRGLQLHQPSLIVHLEPDAVPRQPQEQPARESRRKFPADYCRSEQHRIRPMLTNRVRQHTRVLRHLIVRQPLILRQQHRIRAVCRQSARVMFCIFTQQHRLNTGIQHVRDLARATQQFQCNWTQLAAKRLSHHPDCSQLPALAPRPTPYRPIGRVATAAVKRASLIEILHQLRNRHLHRLVSRHYAVALRLYGVYLAHPCRRSIRAEHRQIIAQFCGGQRGDGLLQCCLPFRPTRIYLRRDILRNRDERRQRASHNIVALVGDSLCRKRRTAVGGDIQLKMAHPAHLWQIEHLRYLRAHLPSLRINAVAPADNQVELVSRQRQGKRARRCQRIAARKRAVVKMHRAVRSHRKALNERVPCLRRPHRIDHHLCVMLLFQIDRKRHPKHIEWIDFARHAITHDPTRLVVELQQRDHRHLLNANSYLHDTDWSIFS